MLTDYKKILGEHFARYPQMLTLDLIKLVHQSEFGGGAEGFDADSPLVTEAVQPLFEDIGAGLYRLYVGPALAMGIDITTLRQIFVNTAQVRRGSISGFKKKLEILEECCQECNWACDPMQLTTDLEAYARSGYPPLEHSELYKKAYLPAYGIACREYKAYFQVFPRIDAFGAAQSQAVVAIDGPAGSGKSSLARLLQSLYGSNVIQMDHFFLRPQQRATQRLREIGGNVDYERFQKEVLPQLSKGHPFQYRVYNCREDTFTWSKPITPGQLTVIEGSYSLHPALGEIYDLKIFLKISPENQSKRIFQRNGPGMHKRFLEEWIPKENAYFAKFEIQEHSDLVIGTD